MPVFEGFTEQLVDAAGITIRVRRGGEGPPVLLLHGNPQTLFMWHAIAARLARDFTVVAADLRGYGDSAKPPTAPDHAPYSKRAMAADQVAVMRRLGFDRFCVAGHDRGGRVAYRMALDHPACVKKLAVLDIVPTLAAFRRTNAEFALGYYHWFFLAQPYDLPERLIGGDPDYFWRRHTTRGPQPPDFFAPEALADYLRCFRNPETIHGNLRGLSRCRLHRPRARPGGFRAQDRLPGAGTVGPQGQARHLVRRARCMARLGGGRARPQPRLRALSRRGGARGDGRRTSGVLRGIGRQDKREVAMVRGRVMELRDDGTYRRRGDHDFVDLPRPGDRIVLGNDEGDLETMRVVRLKHLPAAVPAAKFAAAPLAMIYVEWEEEWNAERV